MSFKWILDELNIFRKCKQYRLPIWRCPQFLFIIMGIVIIATSVTTYGLGTSYLILDPFTVALIVMVLTTILLVITFSIVRSMEAVAEASMLKSEFISIVSHQLRSPISNLKWAIEILLSKRFSASEEKQMEYLGILKENSERMNELVGDLLMVSRIDEGRLPLSPSYFSMESLVREIVNELKVMAEGSGVELELKAPESLPQLFGDYKMLKVVVENLVDNAIRYTKNGGKVTIELEDRQDSMIFEVGDTGIGIPRSDQRHIFEKFFRAGNAASYRTGGSGLGLYISKSIIEKSGGKIDFKSEENKGSTFWFTLPKNKIAN